MVESDWEEEGIYALLDSLCPRNERGQEILLAERVKRATRTVDALIGPDGSITTLMNEFDLLGVPRTDDDGRKYEICDRFYFLKRLYNIK